VTVTAPSLAHRSVALVERPESLHRDGSLAGPLIAELEALGARVEPVDAEAAHRLDAIPAWDVLVLKSGDRAALHLAAAAEAAGVLCVNGAEATRRAQDRIASMALLREAGLPVPRHASLHLDPRHPPSGEFDQFGSRLVVKSAHGSQGKTVWAVDAVDLDALWPTLPAGAYLVMEHAGHTGDDLKVFAAGDWLSAIHRPFPARTYAEKLGRPTTLDPHVGDLVCACGEALQLTCYGVDLVAGTDGWAIVDVNAFPGYKGASGAPRAVAAAIAIAARDSRAARGGRAAGRRAPSAGPAPYT
jgi:ribosomal protein S6--L-glutamate ligase